MLIWSGKGVLVPITIVVTVLIFMTGAESLSGDKAYLTNHPWLFDLVFLVSGGILWALNSYFRKDPKVLLDPQTNKQIVFDQNGSFFFIPLKYWSYILCILGIILTTKHALFPPPVEASEVNAIQNQDGRRELLSFTDRPYSLSKQANDEYLAIGDYAQDVIAQEAGLSVASDGKPQQEKVELDKVLDLTNTVVLKQLEIKSEDLISKPYTIHEMISAIARKKGFKGLIAPSPRVSGGKVLVIFE